MDKGDIYMIRSPSGKKYIGQCVQYLSNGKKWGYLNRFKSHVRDANSQGRDYCRLLNNAIRKYGVEKMIVSFVEECDVKDLDSREAYYIELHNSLTPNGYNLVTGGSNSRQSEETKEKRRQSMYGKNLGKIYPRIERKRPEDKNLPKYLRSYKDKTGKEGYRISNHPTLKTKSFLSKYKSQEEKLRMALNYLQTADTSKRFNE